MCAQTCAHTDRHKATHTREWRTLSVRSNGLFVDSALLATAADLIPEIKCTAERTERKDARDSIGA